MNNPLVFMFPGQGCQYYQMGKELYEKNSVFNYWMNYCSKSFEPLIHVSLADMIYKERPDKFVPFDQTIYTHPAIFAFEYSLHQFMLSIGIKPDFLLGYSFGEFLTSTCAGVLSFEDAIRIINKNAELINNLTSKSSMMAILANKAVFGQYPGQFYNTTIAGINSDNHFVITGNLGKLEDIKLFLSEFGIPAQILPISHGFHSNRIDCIEDEFKRFLTNLSFHEINIPIISSLHMRLLKQDDINSDYYYQIARQPINFMSTIKTMERSGAFTYIDIGPSGTLSNFVKQILKDDSLSCTLTTIDMFGRDQKSIERLLNSLNL